MRPTAKDSPPLPIETDRIHVANGTYAVVEYGYSRTALEQRLKAKVCELCGTTESDCYEVHHVNKLKNLKGKQAWEVAMIAKRRKTLVLCKKCHVAIHNQ